MQLRIQMHHNFKFRNASSAILSFENGNSLLKCFSFKLPVIYIFLFYTQTFLKTINKGLSQREMSEGAAWMYFFVESLYQKKT